MFIIKSYSALTGQCTGQVTTTKANGTSHCGRSGWKTREAAIKNAKAMKNAYQAAGQFLVVKKSTGAEYKAVSTVTGVSYNGQERRMVLYTACASMVIEGIDIRAPALAVAGHAREVHDFLGADLTMIARRAHHIREGLDN